MSAILAKIADDLSVLPKVINDNISFLDASVKVLNSTIDCTLFYEMISSASSVASAEGIKNTFKPINEFAKTYAVFLTYDKWNTEKFSDSWNRSNLFKAKEIFSASASGIEFLKGLESWDLISLGSISKSFGSIPGWQYVAETVDLSTLKDSFVLAATSLSIYSNVSEYYNAEQKNDTKAKYSNKLYTMRVNIIADVAKWVIVALTMTLNTTSYRVVSLVFVAVDLKNLQKPIGWCAAVTGLYKAAHAENK